MQPDAAGNAHAAEIKRNVERLLAARVGPGKAVVEVAVDVVTDREQITERKFDPQGRVAISSETESNTGSSTDPGGSVTVASNLPTGNAGAGASGKSDTSASKERINYEVSETQRDILRNPGAVRKISIAVLVDGQTVTAADGTVTQDVRPDAELLVLRELVASAVGLDEARGDVLTLRSLAFLPDLAGGTLVEAGMFSGLGPIDTMSMIQTIVLALVALVLGLFVIRPVLSSANRRPAELPAPGQTLALPGGTGAGSAVLNGVIDDGTDLPPFSITAKGAEAGEDEVQDPVARLRRLIEERQTESVEILRGWMEYEEERG
jgi:flagellar M-ring protein FliF